MAEDIASIHTDLTTEQRNEDMYMSIDPGLVHIRSIESILPDVGIAAINKEIAAIPSDTPEWIKKVKIDHIYTGHMIAICNVVGAGTLSEILSQGKGTVFCSIDDWEPTEGIYDGAESLPMPNKNKATASTECTLSMTQAV